MRFITKSDVKIPLRKSGSHKGENGYVLAVGGSEDYTGAIALAGLASLRSGCDLVKIVAPEKVAWAINAYSPDLVTMKLKGDYFKLSHSDIVKKEMRNFDVLLIGNGIGLRGESKKFCRKTVKEVKKLKVIDADAIKSISLDDAENSIITPHAKELEYFLLNSGIHKTMTRQINIKNLQFLIPKNESFFDNETNITKKASLIKNITQKFLDNNNIILLKGKIDIIISKDEILFVKGGNPGMAKGGTGDVLAGLCAGFLAQSKVLLQSAVNASYINKQIGNILLKRKKGFTYLASDMVEEIKKIKSIKDIS